MLFCLILTSCNNKDSYLHYFDFDNLEYYHKDITEHDISIEYEKLKLDNYNREYLKIVESEYPVDLNNPEFISNMIKFGYIKKLIKKEKFKKINLIFSKKPCNELTTTACMPIYSDVLVFKKEGKTVGIAKVCFRCRNAYLLGSKQNWDYFGEYGDYEKLEALLNQ